MPFSCCLTNWNVAGCAGDPLFGEEKAEGQDQEFAPQFTTVAVAQDHEVQVISTLSMPQRMRITRMFAFTYRTYLT